MSLPPIGGCAGACGAPTVVCRPPWRGCLAPTDPCDIRGRSYATLLAGILLNRLSPLQLVLCWAAAALSTGCASGTMPQTPIVEN